MKIIPLVLFLVLLSSSLFSELSEAIKAKIGRVFVGTFYGNEVDQNMLGLIQETKIGNWIFFSKCSELTSKSQVKHLLSDLSDACLKNNGYRPLLLIDQEGGRVTHLKGEFRQFPEPALWENAMQAEHYGRELGRELIEVGFSGNLAPVVDIADEVTFAGFKQRMFGESPERVIEMARAFIRGLHSSGSLAVLKHFPGHGAARGDSHAELPVVEKSWDGLLAHDLKPFAELAHEADGVLVGHLIVPSVDSENPASRSEKWQKDILRSYLGFKGMILTDSLTMHGGLKGKLDTVEDVAKAIGTAAIEAFKAGSDLLLIGPLDQFCFEGDREANAQMLCLVVEEFRSAVERGEISEERLDDSLQNMLRRSR